MGRKSLIRPFEIINKYPMSASFYSDEIPAQYPNPPLFETNLAVNGATNIENIDVIGILVEWSLPQFFEADYYDEAGATDLTALIGAAYAPDGTNLADGETCLFASLTTVEDRGVYQATVAAGKVTAWTRVICGQDREVGVPKLNDNIYILGGTVNTDNVFFVDDETLVTFDIATSVPDGELEVQVKSGNSGWSVLDLVPSLPAINTASGSLNINITDFSYEQIRLYYNATSGTGTLNAVLTAKVVGA